MTFEIGLEGAQAVGPGDSIEAKIKDRPTRNCTGCKTELQVVPKQRDVVDSAKQIHFGGGFVCEPCRRRMQREDMERLQQLSKPPSDRTESRNVKVTIDTTFESDKLVSRRLCFRDAESGRVISSQPLATK